MSDTLTLRVSECEKKVWLQVAKAVGEDLSEFAINAVRQRVLEARAKHGLPWNDLLASVGTDAPSATNKNDRKAMRSPQA